MVSSCRWRLLPSRICKYGTVDWAGSLHHLPICRSVPRLWSSHCILLYYGATLLDPYCEFLTKYLQNHNDDLYLPDHINPKNKISTPENEICKRESFKRYSWQYSKKVGWICEKYKNPKHEMHRGFSSSWRAKNHGLKVECWNYGFLPFLVSERFYGKMENIMIFRTLLDQKFR